MPCKKHIEDNMKTKMQSLQLDGSERSMILEDVFGCTTPPKRGLVDCSATEKLETTLADVSRKWDQRFTLYFIQCIADDIQRGMAPGIRGELGLKDDFFYNNTAECHNFRYKLKVEEDKAATAVAGFPKRSCSWVEAIKGYRRMVQECQNNIQRAFIGEGPFTLATDWKGLEVPAAEWMSKTPEERRRNMAKIDPYAKKSAASFGPVSLPSGTNEDSKDDDVVILEDCETTVAASPDPATCLCSFDDSGLLNHLRGSWNNAKQILELNGVGRFPGNDSRMAVISLTSGICHNVSCSGVSKKPLSCDDQCQGFKSQHISYTPRLSTLVNSSILIHTGRKDNEKRQRKRISNGLSDVSGDSAQHIPEDIGTEQRTDDLEVVFIRDTAAYKCYGCNGAVRSKPS